MVKLIIILLLLIFSSCKDKTNNLNNTKSDSVDTLANIDSLTLIFVGDVMAHMPQIKLAEVDKSRNIYNFNDCFKYAAPHWEQADIVIANLETTLSDKNYSGYPMFAAPYTLANGLKSAGVSHLVLANNHTCDRGSIGITKTTKYLEKLGLPYTGAYRDSSMWRESSPLMINKKGFRVALLNYTYGTNGLRIPSGMVVSLIDTLKIKEDLAKAKSKGATNIITFIHWGNEYQRIENHEQRILSKWLRKNGVDIIIGSHPHVVQPYYADSSGVIVYSLGNFISNQRDRYKNGGINAHLTLVKNNNKTEYYLSTKAYYVYKTFKHPGYFCVDSLSADTVIAEMNERAKALQFFKDVSKINMKHSK